MAYMLLARETLRENFLQLLVDTDEFPLFVLFGIAAPPAPGSSLAALSFRYVADGGKLKLRTTKPAQQLLDVVNVNQASPALQRGTVLEVEVGPAFARDRGSGRGRRRGGPGRGTRRTAVRGRGPAVPRRRGLEPGRGGQGRQAEVAALTSSRPPRSRPPPGSAPASRTGAHPGACPAPPAARPSTPCTPARACRLAIRRTLGAAWRRTLPDAGRSPA